MINSLGIKKAPKDTKVVVAMSGGVDSSVVAALMQEEGYDVTGITLKLYDDAKSSKEGRQCCAGQDILDAKRVSEKLNIKRENELGFDKLGIIIEKLKTYKKHIDDEKLKFIEDEFLFLSKEINKDLPSGIIHADLFPDNIFFEEIPGLSIISSQPLNLSQL